MKFARFKKTNTMSLSTIRVGGVPEHFNLPWKLAKERGEFESRGINLEWVDYGGGTGQMTAALRNGDIDVCVLLTEGIIKDIALGNPSKIISQYINTPLIWGVHTGVNNQLQNYRDIYDHKFAISRFGSGSHLMPIIDANLKGEEINKNQFVIIQNIDGALDSLSKNESDVFYWEKYTTKPFVDKGVLRRLGQFVTPWPCFVIAARNEILEEQPENMIRLLRTIHDSCDKFMHEDTAIDQVSKRYALEARDVARWYHSTEWAIHGWVSNKMLNSVIYYLHAADILDESTEIPQLIWER